MLESMTGFASHETKTKDLDKICVELRSTNHKFLDIVLHASESLLSLEDGIKKEIASRIKRGRVTCNINILGFEAAQVSMNKKLIRNYLAQLTDIRKTFKIKNDIELDTLIRLPGVLSVTERNISPEKIWPRLKVAVKSALDSLVRMRQKEGHALFVYLKKRIGYLNGLLQDVQVRFKKVVRQKSARISLEEERVSFLKDSDISEEVERLSFHLRNFTNKLSQKGPVGKELDFITQEMQREANTIGAKSCDAAVSTCVVQIKSEIEKLREQIQNVE